MGVVPACRTLDCVSVLALTVDDARAVYAVAAGYDPADAYSRPAPTDAAARRLPENPRFAVPATPEFYGDRQSQSAYAAALARFDALGATCVPIDFTVLDQVAALLYDGPWVAERYVAIEALARRQPDAIHPVVREIVWGPRRSRPPTPSGRSTAWPELKREADRLIAAFDALLVPTAPTHLLMTAVQADPIRLNSRLGTVHQLRESARLVRAVTAGRLPR